MTATPRPPDLDLPPVEDIERALSLEEPDRGEIPGLYRLNTLRVPLLRLVGIQAVIAFSALHNRLLGLGPGWGTFLVVAAILELYGLTSLVVLRRYFVASRRLHLGTLFLGLDLVAFTLAVWVTGSARSALWPLYLVRVADQMWIGRRRAAIMAVLGIGCYGTLLLATAWHSGLPGTATLGLFKTAWLATFSAYLIAAASLPWDIRERTRAAKELILKLEAQAREIAHERARAEQASVAKSHFLARMSHELRTPLNSVVGFTNVLIKKQGANLPPREHDYLVRIRENGVHLLALINDVLDIARIEEGKMDIQMSDLDLEQLVRNTLHQLEGRVMGSKVRLSVSFPPGIGPLHADEARLRQVLINLVGNAIKFTEEGWVRVEVRAEAGDGVPTSLTVTDSGIGIAPARLDSIFDAFEQGEDGYARRFGGTGLGLAISRSLCRLMGFDLTVESAEGKGSAFTVRFAPAATAAAPPPAQG